MRAHVAIAFALFLPALAVAFDQAVTEADAIRLFLEQSPQARQVPLVAQTAAAELRIDTRVANPEVAYQVEDAAGVRDDFLTIQQELPITGRRGLLNNSADTTSSAAGLMAQRDLQAAARGSGWCPSC